MILDIIISLIAIILLMFGIGRPDIKNGGSNKIDENYRKSVIVKPWDKKWATGTLVKNYPICPYFSKSGPMPLYSGATINQMRTPRHWGQRKLLLTEIDFLSRVDTSKPCTVVYAGAADGRHIPILTELFPLVEFHLYDPRPFYNGIEKYKNIKLNPFYGGVVGTDMYAQVKERTSPNGWFTDEVAEYYSGGKKPIYFISDIRTMPTEEEIELNQRAQENWIRLMQPAMSMLKFKLPYPQIGGPKKYRHMRGEIRFQCWAPVNSAETRLIVTGVPADMDYDIVLYERNLAWYNTIMREHDFSNLKLKDFGIFVDDMTFGQFWEKYNVGHLGWDFVYELIILNNIGQKNDLSKLVDRINTVLVSKGAEFRNYLKGHTAR